MALVCAHIASSASSCDWHMRSKGLGVVSLLIQLEESFSSKVIMLASTVEPLFLKLRECRESGF